MGFSPENVLLCENQGRCLARQHRGMTSGSRPMPQPAARTLADAIDGADWSSLSARGAFTTAMIHPWRKTLSSRHVQSDRDTPGEVAKPHRRHQATGRSDYPTQSTRRASPTSRGALMSAHTTSRRDEGRRSRSARALARQDVPTMSPPPIRARPNRPSYITPPSPASHLPIPSPSRQVAMD